MSIIYNCYICNVYPGDYIIPETEKMICGLCKLELRVTIYKLNGWCYHPPYHHIRTINIFDDGNEKYKSDPNEWLEIGYCLDHPEKISLVNKVTKSYIMSISNWKVGTKLNDNLL